MKIMWVEWPDDVDAVVWYLEARINGQTYRQTYTGSGCWGHKGLDDLRTQLVDALREFARYIEGSAREVRK